jgi:Protein of unknown function (DUF3052)
MPPSVPAGYSGTPLAKKLGIKEGACICLLGAPDHYLQLVAPLPPSVRFVAKPGQETPLVHLFTKDRAELAKHLRAILASMPRDGAIWVSWPKKASKVVTDITEDTIREIALPMGLVDVKVCAVDDVWSGLKLVIRKAGR